MWIVRYASRLGKAGEVIVNGIEDVKGIYTDLLAREYAVFSMPLPPDSFRELYSNLPPPAASCQESDFANRRGVFIRWAREGNGEFREKWGVHALLNQSALAEHPFLPEIMEKVARCCFPDHLSERLFFTTYFFRHDRSVGPLELHRDGASYVAAIAIEYRGFTGGDGHVRKSDGSDVFIPLSAPGLGYIANDRLCAHGTTALETNGVDQPIRDILIVTVSTQS